ncbi:MAG: hypothetical protein IPN77_26580 [Sandaracinaceae bacterium]|nr:hypothetical protein [Sandaracinaceae bacterium]
MCPSSAHFQRGRVVWSLDPPVAKSRDAEQGSSRSAALAGTTLAVCFYATESDHKEWIAAFDVTRRPARLHAGARGLRPA